MFKKIIGISFTVIFALSFLYGCGRETESSKTGSGDGFAPEWTKDAVIYEVNLRQYTKSGSITEFETHLERLKEMGINTLWFMPIFSISKTNRSGSLGSYYSVDDYKAVNPEFGSFEDFKNMAKKAHDMGFHIVLDWVANHTGWDNAWISEHPDWYTQENGKIISPKGMGWPDVADLNYDSHELRKAMIDSMAFWVKECDIDGFRCDYAPGVPADFWKEARQALDKIKPVFFLEEDLGGQSSDLLNEAFDCNYAAKFYENLVLVSHGKTPDKLKFYLQKMPENDFAMFYLDNHDVNSYDRTILSAFSTDNLPAMLGVIFTMPGMPMLYSGNEIAYDHAIAFMEKDTIDWEKKGAELSGVIKSLSDLKISHPSLFAGRFGGEFETVDLGSKSVFAYRRKGEDESLLCVFNLSDKPQDIDLSKAGITDKMDVLRNGKKGETVLKEDQGSVAVISSLEPWEFYIIKE